MLSQIHYIKATGKYAISFNKAVDCVAREKKYLASLTGFSEESTIGFVKMIEKHNLAQFYALDGEKVIGWCDILPKEFEGMKHVGVLGMGILRDYRKKGIGTQLLIITQKHARENNHIEKVDLEVFESNQPAINFYKKWGFCIEGKRIKARKLNGCYDNLVLMGKEI